MPRVPPLRRIISLAAFLYCSRALPALAGVGVWTGVSPRAKSIEAIARDPLNPSRMWAAAFGSGVYRTTDGGATWTGYRAGLINTFVRCLAVQPNHPDSVYCGTNDGVFLSVDGGVDWTVVLPSTTSVRALAVHPVQTGIVFAGTYGNGIFRSINGGSSWSQVNLGLANLNVRDIAFQPSKPETLLAATGTGGGIHRSTTGGLTWVQVPDTTATIGAAEQVQFDRLDPNRVYAAEPDRGVLKSTDAGVTWVRINRGLTSFRCRSLAVVDTLRYVGTDSSGVFVTSLSDTSWHPASTGLTNRRVDALLGNPSSPLSILAGTDGQGMFRSTNGGASWSGLDGGLLNTFGFSLAIRPSTHAVYVGCGLGDQFWRSGDGAAHWTRAGGSLTSHDSEHGVTPDPMLGQRVYLSAYGSGVWRSDDDGATWTKPDTAATLTNPFIRDLVADPAASGHLFVGSGIGPFESMDGGTTWTPRNAGLPPSFSTRALALVPGTPITLYAGDDLDGVWRSSDGGQTWMHKSSGIPAPFIHALLADPSSPLVAYAATDSGVYRTTNGGDQWGASNGGLPVPPLARALARDDLRPSLLFCGLSGAGVFESQDGGLHWLALAGQIGLADLTIRSIAVDAANVTVYAGSDDGVASLSNYPRPGVAVPSGSSGALRPSLSVWPNPVREAEVTMAFTLPETGPVAVGVYDLSGARVRTLRAGVDAAGRHSLFWDGRDGTGRPVGAGLYFVRLSTPHGGASTRFVILGR